MKLFSERRDYKSRCIGKWYWTYNFNTRGNYVTYWSQSLSCGQPIGEGERDRHPVFFARSNRVWTLRNSPDFLNCEYVGLNADVCWLLYLSMNIQQCVSVIKINPCHLHNIYIFKQKILRSNNNWFSNHKSILIAYSII